MNLAFSASSRKSERVAMRPALFQRKRRLQPLLTVPGRQRLEPSLTCEGGKGGSLRLRARAGKGWSLRLRARAGIFVRITPNPLVSVICEICEICGNLLSSVFGL